MTKILNIYDSPKIWLPKDAPFKPTHRNHVKSAILLLLTCGIYGLVWAAKIDDETGLIVGAYDERQYFSMIKYVLYFYTFGFYGIWWAWMQFLKLAEKLEVPGRKIFCYLVLHVLTCGISSLFILQTYINHFVADGNK